MKTIHNYNYQPDNKTNTIQKKATQPKNSSTIVTPTHTPPKTEPNIIPQTKLSKIENEEISYLSFKLSSL